MTLTPRSPEVIHFAGPYELCPAAGKPWRLAQAAAGPGVFLMTVAVGGEHRVLQVGAADDLARALRQRIADYLAGRGTLYPAAALRAGRRHPVAWEATPCTEAALARAAQLQGALADMLPLLHVFVHASNAGPRRLWRLESALVEALRAQGATLAFLEQGRVSLPPNEQRTVVVVSSDQPLCGVPAALLL